MNRYQKTVVDAIVKKLGVVLDAYRPAGSHVMVYFRSTEKRYVCTISCTPSDKRAQQNAIGDIRRQMRMQ